MNGWGSKRTVKKSWKGSAGFFSERSSPGCLAGYRGDSDWTLFVDNFTYRMTFTYLFLTEIVTTPLMYNHLASLTFVTLTTKTPNSLFTFCTVGSL